MAVVPRRAYKSTQNPANGTCWLKSCLMKLNLTQVGLRLRKWRHRTIKDFLTNRSWLLTELRLQIKKSGRMFWIKMWLKTFSKSVKIQAQNINHGLIWTVNRHRGKISKTKFLHTTMQLKKASKSQSLWLMFRFPQCRMVSTLWCTKECKFAMGRKILTKLKSVLTSSLKLKIVEVSALR